jgi:hypothetical protein
MPRNLFSNFVYSPVYTGYVKLVHDDSPIAFYSGDYATTHPAGITNLTDYFSLPGSTGYAYYATTTSAFMGNGNFTNSIYHYGQMVNPLLSATAPLPVLSAVSYNVWFSCTFPTQFSNFWQFGVTAIGQSLFQNGEANVLDFNGVGTSYNLSHNPGTHMVTITLNAPASLSATTTTGSLYIDAVLIKTLTNCPVVGTSATGQMTSGFTQPQTPFTIIVGALSLHSIALSQAQISALYAAGQGV